MPWDVMLPVRSALKTQIPERFISLSFKAKSVDNMTNPSCPDHIPEIPQWGTPVVGVHTGTCPICLENGRHLQIQCLRCWQMPGCCQCLPALRRTQPLNHRCPICRFGPRVSEGERVALLLRWATRGLMSPASQPANQDKEDKGLTATGPFKGPPNDSIRDFLLQA